MYNAGMKSYYVVTIWSGGQPGRKWLCDEKPEVLAEGTGVRFCDSRTGMLVEVIGNICVEQYEHGREEFHEGVAELRKSGWTPPKEEKDGGDAEPSDDPYQRFELLD